MRMPRPPSSCRAIKKKSEGVSTASPLNWIMLFSGIIAVYCEKYMKRINVLRVGTCCGFFNVKADDRPTQNNECALNDYATTGTLLETMSRRFVCPSVRSHTISSPEISNTA